MPFSALNLKFDFISDGGCTREKQIQKALGSLPPCGNRCRFSESAICSSRVHPPSEIKSNFKFKTLRWRPLRWRLTLSDSQTPRLSRNSSTAPLKFSKKTDFYRNSEGRGKIHWTRRNLRHLKSFIKEYLRIFLAFSNLNITLPALQINSVIFSSSDLSCTQLRVPPVALHVSRYTCRSWFPGF